MIFTLIPEADPKLMAFLGILFAYGMTCLLLSTLKGRLPKDAGRAFAHDGKVTEGKPRGAGVIFVLVFTASALLFTEFSRETLIYLILTCAAMLTGFFDDCSETSWGELKKGLLDLAVSVALAITVYNFNSGTIYIHLIGQSVDVPFILYVILATILTWASINVTNCSDGVDGLSSTLSSITLMTVYLLMQTLIPGGSFAYLILVFVVCLLGYLWFNATPSRLMMGDAGSRAMGFFIAVAILKTGSPLLYIPAAIVLLFDGGLGLLKVSLLRTLKIHILKNVRTPLHDHVRKNRGWSNEQTVFKFAIIQIMVSFCIIWLIK